MESVVPPCAEHDGVDTPWTDSGRWGLRQPAHHAAWNSPRRPAHLRGRHFKLNDCHTWARLHFLALREEGLHEHRAFWAYHVQFIGHFIAVYERSAREYVPADAAWSADPAAVAAYKDAGFAMPDLAAD